MASTNLSLRSTEESNSRFAWSGLPGPAKWFETTGGPESDVVAELRREKARLKLLFELANETVSHQELREVVRAVMMSIRNGVLCDGVCIYLESPEGGEFQVYALDFPGDADFQEGTTIPLTGTIAGHVVQTVKPWSGSREEACAHFPRQLMLASDFATGCMLPIPGRQRVIGTFGLVRRENDSFSQDEIDFLVQVANQIAIAVENALAYRQIRELKEKLARESVEIQDEIGDETHFEDIVGKSAALRRVLAKVETVAPTDSTVLIYGETGTGKELIARAIHQKSQRSQRPFISVNCAALAPSLIFSELFGHEKGAFTGATQRRLGRFELANGGTIFLDEVGELPADTQVALLRVLQEREFERVGGTRSLQVHVRVIAATNRNLEAAVADKTFRPDLYYRLHVFPIQVPPLRARKDDLLLLLEYFIHRFGRKLGKRFSRIDRQTLELFQSYEWPGNIRELQNVVERSVILCSGDVFAVDELWVDMNSRRTGSQEPISKCAAPESYGEQQIIEATLCETRGRISGPNGAAARLGVPPSTLDRMIRKLNIQKTHFKYPNPVLGPSGQIPVPAFP